MFVAHARAMQKRNAVEQNQRFSRQLPTLATRPSPAVITVDNDVGLHIPQTLLCASCSGGLASS
jgi:hypothetical protein